VHALRENAEKLRHGASVPARRDQVTWVPAEDPHRETSDIVSAIMYLESAPFVTGEFMHVDGGQSAGH
jgi:NAD(P)-dependent dehydrogenase (short-subunit alcohol dehydrogenase family)